MPGSVAASDAGSAWTVDRDAFNTHGHDRASAIADMQARLQAALLTTKMDVVQKALLDAIDLEAEELEEAMLEVQAYMNRKETKGSKAPRFITDTSLRPVGPRPVSNGSLKSCRTCESGGRSRGGGSSTGCSTGGGSGRACAGLSGELRCRMSGVSKCLDTA